LEGFGAFIKPCVDVCFAKRKRPKRDSAWGNGVRVLCEALYGDGVVRCVFVEVREAQHEFQHAIALPSVRFVGARLKLLHCCERVGKQPFQIVLPEWFAALAIRKRLLGANGGFVQKMIEAKLRTSERRRYRILASGPVAILYGAAFHLAPVHVPQEFVESSIVFL
jgi:hypothetical protein